MRTLNCTRAVLFRVALLVAIASLAATLQAADGAARKPNFVVLFADDLGYADLHCFGGKDMVTPNLDAMAVGGMRLTSFYASQAVCSASRSSLLTGCYNVRISILGALGPKSKTCLNPDEQTIAEVLKPQGYRTAIFGKWHLGDRLHGLPTQHGFDEYHGLPYSNDMWPFHPTSDNYPPLPLFENETVVNDNVTPEDQQYLTRWATEHAVNFIHKSKAEPFFLYVPYSMPHVPIFASAAFRDSTGKGLFTDVIAEIDGSVGQILAALKADGLDENTLVLFTSDNGPWLSYGDHAGSAGPLREGKGTAWEGGQREPTIAYWPGEIPAGTTSDEIAGTIDVLPTLAHLAGAALPANKIDGVNLWPLLSGVALDKSPRDCFFYYWGQELHAVRSGPWKLHFPHSYRTLVDQPGSDGKPGPYHQLTCGLELYNLVDDIGESRDVSADHPEIIQRLQKLAEAKRQELGDKLTQVQGAQIRPAGVLP